MLPQRRCWTQPHYSEIVIVPSLHFDLQHRSTLYLSDVGWLPARAADGAAKFPAAVRDKSWTLIDSSLIILCCCFSQGGSHRSPGQHLQRRRAQDWSECRRTFAAFSVDGSDCAVPWHNRACVCLSGLPDGEWLRQPGAGGDDHAGGRRGWRQHLQETQRRRRKISALFHVKILS